MIRIVAQSKSYSLNGKLANIMTATFERNGLRFVYPESWKLTEFSETEEFYEVSLESPDGSIWSVSVFPGETSHRQLIDSCVEGLRAQYDDLEVTHFEGEFMGNSSTGFDADFYCLDFLITAHARVVKLDGQTLSFFFQAENREFEKLLVVFNAISFSLMRSGEL